MSSNDRERRKQIEERLTGASKTVLSNNEWTPWFEPLDEPYRDWDPLTAQIHAEIQAGDGEITKYLIDKFVEVATWAVPIIDDVEGTQA